MFPRGRLWREVLDTTERARRSGALQPLSTRSTWVRDHGVDFLVRIVSSLQRKAEDSSKCGASPNDADNQRNPFLPYEPEMFVADVSPTHLCLLNKFNVIDYHLLIVTRSYEDQEDLLTLQDFEAAWACMSEYQGLAFHNGGQVAGASQPHKHLQLIPLPMSDTGPAVPIEPLFASAQRRDDTGNALVPGLPFAHAFARLDPKLVSSPQYAARRSLDLYRAMLKAVGLEDPAADGPNGPARTRQAGPYNLLFTREWMLLVPRSVECFQGISVNALGFAGALLVRDEDQMRVLTQQGPTTALAHTGLPRLPAR